jgi:hypothetical protein
LRSMQHASDCFQSTGCAAVILLTNEARPSIMRNTSQNRWSALHAPDGIIMGSVSPGTPIASKHGCIVVIQ